MNRTPPLGIGSLPEFLEALDDELLIWERRVRNLQAEIDAGTWDKSPEQMIRKGVIEGCSSRIRLLMQQTTVSSRCPPTGDGGAE